MTELPQELPLFPGVASLNRDASLSAAIQAWATHLEDSGRSINTVKAFTGDLRLLSQFVGAGQSLGAIGNKDLRNYLDWMQNGRGVPCSPKTYSRRVTSLKAFFRWLNGAGVLTDDPAASIPQQSVLSPLPEVLTQDEVLAVLKAAEAARAADPPDARPYTLVGLLLQTGIKKGECLGIHLNHIDLQSVDGPILWIRYRDVSKRYRERKLSLDAAWVPVYKEYLSEYSPSERLFDYSPRRLEYLLEELGDEAGLDKHLSFNMCRWTAALTDYKAGMDRNALRRKLGISKIQWREVGLKLDRLAGSAR